MSNINHHYCIAGCGRMGEPMLAALLNNGLNATGFDVRPPTSYGSLCDRMTDDPAQIPAETSVLFSVVRDIPQTDDLLFGTQNLLVRLPNLTHVVVCSTLSPRYIHALKSKLPCTLIDAPMSGAAIAAKQERLSFMLGGSLEEIEHIQPALDAMGTYFHHMGDTGSGMAAKVLNNLLAASSTVMTRLVLDWADEFALDEAKLLSLIHTSSGQNWLASGFDDIEFARDGYKDDNTIGILKKDVASALDAAPASADTSLPDLLVSQIAKMKPRD